MSKLIKKIISLFTKPKPVTTIEKNELKWWEEPCEKDNNVVMLARYFVADPRFKMNGTLARSFDIIVADRLIGYVWCKNMLGGWRLSLEGEGDTEWMKRGVIKEVWALESILQGKYIPPDYSNPPHADKS